MAKPNAPKDIKPKAEDELAPNKKGVGLDNNAKIILINLASTLLICVLFVSVNYILQDNLLSSKLANKFTNQEEGQEDITTEETGDEEIQRGFIVDLGDFVLNLSDANARKYLKVNVALELSKTATDPDLSAKPAEGGGHGGHGEAAAPEDPMKVIETEMAQFKPAIRDAIITNLSSKTSAELSTAAGKELAKDQIAESVNALFAGEREVLRVSFGQFIIQ